MTNKEAAKWIQIYIDEWNKDLNQMEGFGMCLNEKGKKMMKAIEMGRDALKRTDERTKTHACDSIGRSMAVNAVQRIAHMATLPDDDVVIRKSAVEYVLLHLPSAQLANKSSKVDKESGELISRQAVEHLDWFTKLYCRDKSITDDLVFRCEQCEFEMPDGGCLVKVMARKLCPDYKDFGAMGDL